MTCITTVQADVYSWYPDVICIATVQADVYSWYPDVTCIATVQADVYSWYPDVTCIATVHLPIVDVFFVSFAGRLLRNPRQSQPRFLPSCKYFDRCRSNNYDNVSQLVIYEYSRNRSDGDHRSVFVERVEHDAIALPAMIAGNATPATVASGRRSSEWPTLDTFATRLHRLLHTSG